MARGAAEAAKGTTDFLSGIQEVKKSTRDSNTGAQKVNVAAVELAKTADRIQKMAERFKVEEDYHKQRALKLVQLKT